MRKREVEGRRGKGGERETEGQGRRGRERETEGEGRRVRERERNKGRGGESGEREAQEIVASKYVNSCKKVSNFRGSIRPLRTSLAGFKFKSFKSVGCFINYKR